MALQCHSAKQDVTAGALIPFSKKTHARSEQSKDSAQVTNVLQRSIFTKFGVKVYILLEVASQGPQDVETDQKMDKLQAMEKFLKETTICHNPFIFWEVKGKSGEIRDIQEKDQAWRDQKTQCSESEIWCATVGRAGGT